MFEVHHHHVIPQPQALEVAHQVAVDDCELAGQVGLDRQVAKARLNRGIHADDVGNSGRGRNGGAVGVAHAVFGNLVAQGVPIKGR